jgi:glycine cleavage system H protein
MADDLTFLMGKYEARLPGDRRYARNHMWGQPANGRLRFGFTSYAVRLMQDVYFLEWSLDAEAAVAAGQPVGHIETSKAVSDLFTPMPGTIAAFNQELLQDPSAINVDNHGTGWLFEMTGDESGLMSPQEYHDFLAANWDKTQAVLKGQVNME